MPRPAAGGFTKGGVSSVGRASDLAFEGRGFESRTPTTWIAQSGRASDQDSECRGFDSRSNCLSRSVPSQHPGPCAPRASPRAAWRLANTRLRLQVLRTPGSNVHWTGTPPAPAAGPRRDRSSAYSESATPTPCRLHARAGSPSRGRRGEPFSSRRRGLIAARLVLPHGLGFGSATHRRLAVRLVLALANAGCL